MAYHFPDGQYEIEDHQHIDQYLDKRTDPFIWLFIFNNSNPAKDDHFCQKFKVKDFLKEFKIDITTASAVDYLNIF